MAGEIPIKLKRKYTLVKPKGHGQPDKAGDSSKRRHHHKLTADRKKEQNAMQRWLMLVVDLKTNKTHWVQIERKF